MPRADVRFAREKSAANRWFCRTFKILLAGGLSLGCSQAQQVGQFTIPPASLTTPSTYTGYAYCTDANGYFVPYCNPSLASSYYIYTGGHIHEDSSHISNSYSGYLTATGSNTYTVGLQVTYHATRTGEREFIQVCANTCSTTDALIRNVNLQQLWPGYNFVLIGDKPWHPANHLAAQNTIDAIVAITQDYSSHYYTDPNYTTMGVNDEALEWGGVFDICETYAAACKEGVLPWQPPHKSHDNGLAADFRANGDPNSIVSNAFEDFKNYCRVPGRLGNYVKTESVGTSNQHIHCDSN